jgi:RNA polymerase sigma-70 factor (ECF subfamily)
MNCDDLVRVLVDYGDGAADDCLCREVEEHLAGCPACDTLRKDLERVSRLCRESPRPCLPEDLRQRLLSQIRSTRTPGQ